MSHRKAWNGPKIDADDPMAGDSDSDEDVPRKTGDIKVKSEPQDKHMHRDRLQSDYSDHRDKSKDKRVRKTEEETKSTIVHGVDKSGNEVAKRMIQHGIGKQEPRSSGYRDDRDVKQEDRSREQRMRQSDQGGRGQQSNICFKFQSGKCDRGEGECRFQHIIDTNFVPRTSTSSNTDQGICFAFQKGTCNNGDTCRFKHIIQAEGDQVCRKFQQGSCTFGVKCKFSHAGGAVKPPEMSRAEWDARQKELGLDGSTGPVDIQPTEQPNYEKSGALYEEENKIAGISTDYAEPDDARVPEVKWRLYVFKGNDQLNTFAIYRQTMYMVGKNPQICDILTEHPSCSKQHAVIQYRNTTNKRGESSVKPYIIDIGSTNGTKINGKMIEKAKYVELLPKDVITFGLSTREYVLLHEAVENDQKESEQDRDKKKFKGMYRGMEAVHGSIAGQLEAKKREREDIDRQGVTSKSKKQKTSNSKGSSSSSKKSTAPVQKKFNEDDDDDWD